MFSKMRTWQRLACLVLALGLIFTMVPASVFADETLIAGTTASSSAPAEEEESAIEEEPAVVEEPAVEEEPAIEEEPVVEEEPAVESDAPVAMSAAPSARRVFDEHFVIENVADGVSVYAGLKQGFDNTWYAEWENVSSIFYDKDYWQNALYYFVKVPNGKQPTVKFTNDEGDYVDGTIEAVSGATDVPAKFISKAKELGCEYMFRFTGTFINNLGETTKIQIGMIDAPEADQTAYYYLRRPDTLENSSVEKTDFYYIGEGQVTLAYTPQAGFEIEDPDVSMLKEPDSFNAIVFDKDLAEKTTYTYDPEESNKAGTYYVESWSVIKGESGATTAYPENKSLLPADHENDPTWHVDGQIVLNLEDAYYYLRIPGTVGDDATNFYYMGKGGTVLTNPTVGEEYRDFDSEKLLQLPAGEDAFPAITYNGVTYTYDWNKTGNDGTYSVESWKLIKGESGATTAWPNNTELVEDSIPTWHVDGIIKLNGKVDIPEEIRPEKVADVNEVYNGEKQTLDVKENESFTVKYQVKEDGKWVDWTDPTTVPGQTDVGSLDVKIIYTYNKDDDDVNDYKDWTDEATITVSKRDLNVTVANAAKTVGQSDPQFTLWEIDGLLEGHIIPEEVGLEFSRDPGESAGSYDINCVVKVINAQGDTTGKNLIGNYEPKVTIGTLTIHPAPVNPTPDPTPNPTPVPTPVPETPVIPVAPVTPADDGDDAVVDDGEDAEDIEDEETPQASPEATPAPEATAEPEEIEDDATAQAGVSGWALINLILMVLTVLAGLVMLGLRFAGKSGALHLIGVVPALVSLIAFFVTEDMSLPMVMTDRWTLIMALIAVVQIVLMVLGRHGQDNKDNANA